MARCFQNLVDYPIDTNGLKIGRNVAFSISHRHFSLVDDLSVTYHKLGTARKQRFDRKIITTLVQHASIYERVFLYWWRIHLCDHGQWKQCKGLFAHIGE